MRKMKASSINNLHICKLKERSNDFMYADQFTWSTTGKHSSASGNNFIRSFVALEELLKIWENTPGDVIRVILGEY